MRWLALFLPVALVAGLVRAELPAPGSTYHILFVSSALYRTSGSAAIPPAALRFGSIAGADYQLTDTAATASLPGMMTWNGVSPIYHAILSTSGDNAATRLSISGPVYNMHGTQLATSKADLFDGNIPAAIDYDEFGTHIVSNPEVWSGCGQLGTWAGSSCGTWNSTSSNVTGRIGSAVLAGNSWIDIVTNQACNQSNRLYGLSPAVTAPLWGDYDGSGTVDGGDYVLWRRNVGTNVYYNSFAAARSFLGGNSSQPIGMADYNVWRDHFGQTLPAAIATAVPEPTTLVLLAIAAAAYAGRRSRRTMFGSTVTCR